MHNRYIGYVNGTKPDDFQKILQITKRCSIMSVHTKNKYHIIESQTAENSLITTLITKMTGLT